MSRGRHDRVVGRRRDRPVRINLTSVLVDDHSQRIDLRPQGRMGTDIANDFAYARKQPGIIQHWLAHAYAVLT